MRKFISAIILWAFFLSLLAGCTSGSENEMPASAALTKNIGETAFTVHWDNVFQQVDGFGGSSAFKKGDGLMRVKEPQRSQLLDMIFSQEKGIGVSILRLMIGDEENGKAEIIEPQKGVFVWDDPEWEKKKADFDRGQIWLANEAKKRGVTTFLATAWSPPAWMKTNDSYNGNGTGELKPECYQDYADYLAEYVLGYKKHFDLDIGYISFANEPDIAPEYPGCLWSAENMAAFIRGHLGPTFEKRGVTAKIVTPENVHFDETMAASIMSDPEAEKYIGVVATHAYGIGYTPSEFPVSLQKGKPIWQTEFMGADFTEYQDNTITDALRYAALIGNMFRTTGINAYFYWWLAANNKADGSDLIRLCTDGEGNTPTENGLFRVFKRYYAFGNYSRFIRPGYEMINTDGGEDDELLVTSYKDPKTGNFAIVAVNRSQEPRRITLELNGFPGNTKALVPYRTSASENLKMLKAVQVSNGLAAAELKGQSVTTFVPDRFAPEPLEDRKDVFSILEAEENDGMSQGLEAADCPDGGKMIANVGNNSYIKYGNVNFGDGSAKGTPDMVSVLFMNARVEALRGGVIEVRLDDPENGRVVGKMDVFKRKGSADWNTVYTPMDTKAPDGARGFHDLYLVFKSDGDKMFNINYFGFSDMEY